MKYGPRDHRQHVVMFDHIGWAHIEHQICHRYLSSDRFVAYTKPIVIYYRVHAREIIVVIRGYEVLGPDTPNTGVPGYGVSKEY